MIKKFDVYEEIAKEVMPFGNGSIVYTPKKWIGQRVRVILEKEPLNIKESVMHSLQPHLEDVKGVFLSGSFARGEQNHDSDIDVLVIIGEKFNLEKKGRIDYTLMEEKVLRKELKGKDPFYLYSVVQEAKPILNESLLNELKKIKINKYNFEWMLEEAKSALKIAEEFLKLDKMQERKKLDSIAIIQTLMLRLRRIFMVQCILKNQKYSNKEFKLYLEKKGLPKELVERLCEIYGTEKSEKTTDREVSIEEAQKLFEMTKKELGKMRDILEWHQKRKLSRE